MNYITLAIIALTVLPIVFGVLFGLMRGSRRSLLRLILVLICIVLAFVLCGVVARGVLGMEISKYVGSEDGESVTVKDYLLMILNGMLGDKMPESVGTLVVILVEIIVKVVLFLILFGVLMFLTWAIVFPICKTFVKPKKVKDSKGETIVKKRRWLGAIFGLIQGVAVGLCVCIVLSGLLVQTNKLMVAINEFAGGESDNEVASTTNKGEFTLMDNEVDGEEGNFDDGYIDDEETDDEQPDGPGSFGGFEDISGKITEYSDSIFGKMYNSIGAKPFDWLAKVKDADGKTYTLSGQVDAISGMIKMARILLDMLNQFQSGDIFANGIDGIVDLFNQLAMLNELGPEAKGTINAILQDVASSMLGDSFGDVDLSGITDVDFAKEGQIIQDLYDYSQKETLTKEDTKDMIEKAAESDLVLTVLESSGSNLSNEFADNKDMIQDAIDGMENIDEARKDRLRDIFGINKTNTDTSTDTGTNTDTEVNGDTGTENELSVRARISDAQIVLQA